MKFLSFEIPKFTYRMAFKCLLNILINMTIFTIWGSEKFGSDFNVNGIIKHVPEKTATPIKIIKGWCTKILPNQCKLILNVLNPFAQVI